MKSITDILQNTHEKPEVISFLTIRHSVGTLGVCLPFVLLAGNLLMGCSQIQPSISHYYYTAAGSIFVGALCAVGLFLISYKGFGALDDFATNIAGAFAFGIAFFPTSGFEKSACSIFNYPDTLLRTTIHYGCAALFFLTLAYISFFLFTRSNGVKTKQKIARNKIYRTSAILMIVFVILIPICANSILNQYLGNYNPTFWLESAALVSFGLSWLVKGEMLIKDK